MSWAGSRWFARHLVLEELRQRIERAEALGNKFEASMVALVSR